VLFFCALNMASLGEGASSLVEGNDKKRTDVGPGNIHSNDVFRSMSVGLKLPESRAVSRKARAMPEFNSMPRLLAVRSSIR
jgi:hypothetical protein